MQIGQQIEYIRQQEHIPVFVACNMLGLASEQEYQQVINGNQIPAVINLIMFVESSRKSLNMNN